MTVHLYRFWEYQWIPRKTGVTYCGRRAAQSRLTIDPATSTCAACSIIYRTSTTAGEAMKADPDLSNPRPETLAACEASNEAYAKYHKKGRQESPFRFQQEGK